VKLGTPLSTRDIYPLKSLEDADEILQTRIAEVKEKLHEKFGVNGIRVYLFGSQMRGTRGKTHGEPDIDLMVYHPTFHEGPRVKVNVITTVREISAESEFKVDIRRSTHSSR